MRVGLVCPYDWSVPGGVQTQVAGLARSLAVIGLEVTVIAPAGSPSRQRPVARHGASTLLAGVPPERPAGGAGQPYLLVSAGRSVRVPANGSIAPVAPTPAAMARTVVALRRLSPDVVHVHEPLTPGPSLAAMLAGPQPIVATFHRSGLDRLYRAEGRLLGGVMKRAACAVAVSPAAAETARAAVGSHLGRREVIIVPNGVVLGPYVTARQAAASTGDQGPPTIVFVGRHEERKGLRVLLEAFGRLPAEVSLDVIGDGPSSDELRSGFPDPRIRWLGSVPDEEKAQRLALADLVVAPSLGGESFGVVLLEAMAAGTAVVASDLPAYRLAAGEAALLVLPGDRLRLADALTSLLSDRHERERLVAAGERVAAAHSMDVIASRYEELYRAVAAPRRSRPR